MASSNPARKPKPLSSHPLFPAVVALWFGALFGLGSLAIRPTVIESLVVATGIDLIVPAAAPPLGITARALIALGLAALGALVGVILARRLARNTAGITEQQRKTSRAVISRARRNDEESFGDAAPRRPISAHEELGEQLDSPLVAPGSAAIGQLRRRGLTVDHEERPFEPHELAPLPGGDLQFTDRSLLSEPVPPAAFAEAEAEPLDLAAFAPPASAPTPSFQPEFVAPVEAVAAPEPNFGRAPWMTTEAAPAAPALSGEAAFGQSIDPARPFSVPTDEPAPSPIQPAAPGFAAPAFAAPTSPAFAPLVEPVAAAPFAAPPVAPAQVAAEAHSPAVPNASDLAAAPAPATLGMTDLASRLQESMARRRAAKAAAPVPAALPVAAGLSQPVAQETAAHTFVEPGDDVPAVAGYTAPAFEVPAFAAPAFDVPPAAIPAAFAAQEPAAAPEARPAIAAAPAPFAAPEPGFAPQPAFAPATAAFAAAPPRFDAPVVPASPTIPAAPIGMPAALRPIGFDLDDDDGDHIAFMPPRHLAMPTAPATPAFAEPIQPAQPFAAVDFVSESDFGAPDFAAAAAEPDAEESASAQAEQVFGSLLKITPPAARPAGFVRIEDSSGLGDAIEPVVIFPGQAMPSIAPAAAPQGDAAPQRRFDAPDGFAAGAPIAGGTAAPAIDPVEAEQALRAALANLQRMSGAA